MVGLGNRGFALLVAIAATALMGGAVLVATRHLQSDAGSYQRELRDVTLVALSDAAMAESIARASANPGFQGFPARSFGGGTITSIVHSSSSSRCTIIATGTALGWKATIEAEVERTPEGPRIRSWSRQFTR